MITRTWTKVIVVVHVDVHDLKLDITDNIGHGDARNQGGDHRPVFLVPDVITAVHRVHRDADGRKGEHRCRQGTVDITEIGVVQRHAIKKDNTEDNMQYKSNDADHEVDFSLAK